MWKRRVTLREFRRISVSRGIITKRNILLLEWETPIKTQLNQYIRQDLRFIKISSGRLRIAMDYLCILKIKFSIPTKSI